MLNAGPNGMTANAEMPTMAAMAGARKKTGTSAPAGVRSSLKISFRMSASGCRRPNVPTRLGPSRDCMNPCTRRSMNCTYATAVISTSRITTSLTTMTMNSSCMAASRLAVHFAQHDVDAGDAGDHVGHVAAAHHRPERLQVDERRPAEVTAHRFGRAVADDVHAELALGRLDRMVRLAGRRLDAFGEALEVMDQRLHAGGELFARGWDDLAVAVP